MPGNDGLPPGERLVRTPRSAAACCVVQATPSTFNPVWETLTEVEQPGHYSGAINALR